MPREPVDAELHRLDERLLLLDERPGRAQILRSAARICSCWSRRPSMSPRSASSLIPGVVSCVFSCLPRSADDGRDAADVVDVVLVRGALLVAAAVVDDEDEDDREHDRTGDEHAEAVELRPARRRGAAASGARRRLPGSRRPSSGVRLDGRRLVEEVELDVGLRVVLLAVEHSVIRVEEVAESNTQHGLCRTFRAERQVPRYGRCSQRSRSPRTTSSSAGTGRSGPWAAAAAARSGSPATSTTAATSR